MSVFPPDIRTAPSWWLLRLPWPTALSDELGRAWQAAGRPVLLGTHAEACRATAEGAAMPAAAPPAAGFVQLTLPGLEVPA